MEKRNAIKSYTVADLAARRARGESRTDLARVQAKSDAELERDVAGDPDLRDVPEDWHAAAEAVMPVPKKLLSLRLDEEVIEWFRSQGPGYQTRMNAVLRAFVEQRIKQAAASAQGSSPT